MKFSTLLLTTIMAGSAALPAFAQSAATSGTGAAGTAMQNTNATGSTTASTTSANDQQMQQAASQIIGNINIAEIALAHGMNDDATSHINAARKDISAMNSQMTPYNSTTPMTAGKMTYKTASGESNYWVPVVNDHFVVRTLDGKHLASKNPDIDVTDAQTVHYKLLLDTKVADEQLAKAQTDIGEKKYDMAMTDLQGVSKGAISELTAEDRPLEATRDNLILSKELLQDKDYRGASFALKHANSELSQVEKANPGSANNTDIKDMRSQIDSLQASIAKEDPSALKTAEMKIDGWIKDVKAKITNKS